MNDLAPPHALKELEVPFYHLHRFKTKGMMSFWYLKKFIVSQKEKILVSKRIGGVSNLTGLRFGVGSEIRWSKIFQKKRRKGIL